MKNQRQSRRKRRTTNQPHTLNVRTGENARTRRVRRVRLLHWAFKGAVVASGAVMCLVLLSHGYQRIFIEDTHFTLRQIQVETNGKTERSKVLAVTGVHEGINLLRVDLAATRVVLEELPQVERAEVRRVLPDTLSIRLHERVPVAWISAPVDGWRPRSALYGLLAGEDGRLFRCTRLTPDLLGLPTLEPGGSEDLRPGGRLAGRPALAGLRLLDHSLDRPTDPMAAPLAQACVRNDYTIEVETVHGVKAWLGIEDTLGDYQKLGAVIAEFASTGNAVAFANLLPRRNIAVRLGGQGGGADAAVPRARLVAPPPATAPSRTAGDRTRDVRAILNRR